MQDVSSALYLESFKKNKITSLYKHAGDIFERLVNTLYSEFNKDWLSEIKNDQLAKATIGNLTLLSVADHLPWKNPQDLINRLEKVCNINSLFHKLTQIYIIFYTNVLLTAVLYFITLALIGAWQTPN